MRSRESSGGGVEEAMLAVGFGRDFGSEVVEGRRARSYQQKDDPWIITGDATAAFPLLEACKPGKERPVRQAKTFHFSLFRKPSTAIC